MLNKIVILLIGSSVALRIKDDPNWNSNDGYFTNHFKDENKSPFPLDYAVPNYGEHDKDMADSLANTETAEKTL